MSMMAPCSFGSFAIVPPSNHTPGNNSPTYHPATQAFPPNTPCKRQDWYNQKDMTQVLYARHRSSSHGTGKDEIDESLERVRWDFLIWILKKKIMGHTGNQQHEQDNNARPSGRIAEVNWRARAERLLSSELGLGSLVCLLSGGGQLLHDMLDSWFLIWIRLALCSLFFFARLDFLCMCCWSGQVS